MTKNFFGTPRGEFTGTIFAKTLQNGLLQLRMVYFSLESTPPGGRGTGPTQGIHMRGLGSKVVPIGITDFC